MAERVKRPRWRAGAWRYRSRPKKAILALLTLLMTLALAELGVRCWLGLRDGGPIVRRHPVAGYAARPNLVEFPKTMGTDVLHYSTTSEGFRVTSERAVDPHRPHVVLLGDSYVFGWNADDRDTLGFQLSEQISSPVVSLAFNGYGTDVQLALLRDHVRRFGAANVTAVVVMTTTNDLSDVLALRRLGRAKPHFVRAGSSFAESPFGWTWRDYLLDTSWLAHLTLVPGVFRSVTPTNVSRDQAVALVCHILAQVGTLCADNHIAHDRLYFETLGRVRVLPADGASLLSACEAVGVPMEDISALITAEAPVDQLLAGDGRHWNRAGNARVAHLIAERLARRSLVER